MKAWEVELSKFGTRPETCGIPQTSMSTTASNIYNDSDDSDQSVPHLGFEASHSTAPPWQSFLLNLQCCFT